MSLSIAPLRQSSSFQRTGSCSLSHNTTCGVCSYPRPSIGFERIHDSGTQQQYPKAVKHSDNGRKSHILAPHPPQNFEPHRTHNTTSQVFKIYALGTSALLATESLPLLLTPKLINSLLSADPRRITDLETYLCRTLGLTLVTLSTLNLLLTGALPLPTTTTATSADDETNGTSTSKNPYSFPTLTVTLTYHALTSFYLYTQLTYTGWNFGFTCGLIGSASLFCLGLWVVLFGSEKGRISKTTGADKRTGNFPFTNLESKSEKKKESKRRSVGMGARTKSKSAD